MATYIIPIGPAGDPHNFFTPGDKISWKNDSGLDITVFNLPTCVSPQQSPAPIAIGETTSRFTINNGSKGEYAYSWADTEKIGPRNGTIDVN